MKKSDLKKLEKEELISLLIDLSKLDKKNNAFLESKLNSNFDDLFKLSCKKIDKAFCCFELMSLKNARQTLIDFKKSKPSNDLFIDLSLYYIKIAYRLEETDWRFQENFYLAIEKVYDIIFEIIKNDKSLIEKYKIQIEKLIKNSQEGWAHQDYLKEKFEEILK